MSESVTQNQANLRVWNGNTVDSGFSLPTSMVNYISKMLHQTEYATNDLLDLRLSVYDPKDHEVEPGDLHSLYQYIFRVPGLVTRAAQIPVDCPPEP